MKGIDVRYFYAKMKDKLKLRLVAGERGLTRRIRVAEIERPGLALAGYFEYFAWRRIQVFGKVEVTYLRSLRPEIRRKRLRRIFIRQVPCIIVTRNYKPGQGLVEECERAGIPLFRSSLITMVLTTMGTTFLDEEFGPSTTMPGNLMEVFGIGVMIRGKSGVGKSEAALGLIEKGHRLVTDDIVRIKLREGRYLIGTGADVTRHHMEIRGLGIINVQALFGAVCFRDEMQIDMAVDLEPWDSEKQYERLGLRESTITLLGVSIPSIVIPVRSGRDIVLLIETAALNQRLRRSGFNPAQELNQRLIRIMGGSGKGASSE